MTQCEGKKFALFGKNYVWIMDVESGILKLKQLLDDRVPVRWLCCGRIKA
jgi:hypothetical protein